MDQTAITTNIKINKCSYLWTIKNFNLAFGYLNEGLESPTFTDGKTNNLAWCLKLTKGYDFVKRDNKVHLMLYLKLVSSDKIEVSAIYKFSVVNDKGEETFIPELKKNDKAHVFRKESSVIIDLIRWNASFIQQNGLLCDDKLKIFCQISVMEIVRGDDIESIIKVPECRLIDDYEILFETKKFYDVILSVADGKEFQVHKTILAARSPVFAAMFEHEMEERKLNRVNITDIDYDILHELLKFIYTGKVENLQTMAGELLAAADKYAQERLKVLCEKELAANLSTENVVEILVLADLHGANQLKAQAIDFIKNNPNVMTTMEWKKSERNTLAFNYRCMRTNFFFKNVSDWITN